MPETERVAIIGAGPAGLIAADVLSAREIHVDIYDAMPSFGRKFLMAGKSGLNISHNEDPARFLTRYVPGEPLANYVGDFGAKEITAWMNGLGIEEYVGSTGRIFPTMMKASPLLRALLRRLQSRGSGLHTRHRWTGWGANGALTFDTPEGPRVVSSAATLLALGGASWKRLGSDGAWREILSAKGVSPNPFQPSNCGFIADWSPHISDKFAGTPVKSVSLSSKGGAPSRSEFVITKNGVEGGGIYMLSAALRASLLERGEVHLNLDLLPDLSEAAIADRLGRKRGKATLSNHLRKTLNLSGVKLALLYELADKSDLSDPEKLASILKSLPLPLTGMAPLDEAISTTGGISWDMLDQSLMLRDLPSVFCAGEMIDWDAPTGGYLITACLATGHAAALGIEDWLSTLTPA